MAARRLVARCFAEAQHTAFPGRELTLLNVDVVGRP